MIGIVIIMAILTASAFANDLHYAMIIDAGSTGSRLHIFQYSNEKIPEIMDLIPPETTKPGLSVFEKNPTAAGLSLKKLLDNANQAFITNHIDPSTVPISILGTAGMRSLNPNAQQLIYHNIRLYIKNHYPFPIRNIQTISGKMEGVYGWLDVNYLEKNFQTNSPTVGIIDMGGASTQIAFAITNSCASNNKTILNINGKKRIIFSKSFLGLGQDKARDSMNKNNTAMSCYPKNYILPDQKIGNFDFKQCSRLYANLIKKYRVKQQILLLKHKKFIAYSSIYYSCRFFNVLTTPDQNTFEKNIKLICSQSWDNLQKKYSDQKYLSNYCANGSYINQLIYHTYRLQKPQLTVKSNINNKDIDWTLGALLYHLL